MKKLGLVSLFLMTAFTRLASADVITCSSEGNTFGVVRVVAHADDTETVQDIFSLVTIKQTDGHTDMLPMFISKGSLVGGFQIAPAFESGPFGIKQTYLAKKNGNFVLETKTFCNSYYQEESCQDSDLLNVTFDSALHCTLDN